MNTIPPWAAHVLVGFALGGAVSWWLHSIIDWFAARAKREHDAVEQAWQDIGFKKLEKSCEDARRVIAQPRGNADIMIEMYEAYHRGGYQSWREFLEDMD